ncbi:MAG: FkbM family methyltransferase [Verrucomicrobia bacterium]|nr:FkbM family methyltransferase [Verrucomicrobiota bacterium]
MITRPWSAPICGPVLKMLSEQGRLDVRFSLQDQERRAFLRLSELPFDLQSFMELAVGDCYRLAELPTPDLIVDGGGNTGMFLLAAQARWPRARLISCEPVPQNLELLQEHARINRLHVDAMGVCLGGRSGETAFYCREANQGSFSPELAYDRVISVDVVPLSRVCRPAPGDRTLIKLDIEGAEVEVLEEFLERDWTRTTIVGELHHQAESRMRLTPLLQRRGWTGRLFDISERCAQFHLFSPDSSLPINSLPSEAFCPA